MAQLVIVEGPSGYNKHQAGAGGWRRGSISAWSRRFESPESQLGRDYYTQDDVNSEAVRGNIGNQSPGMPPLTKDVIKFGSFTVTSQVFHLTALSYALVNLKPLLPGHVLVSPRRVVPRFNDLTSDEVRDLFQTAQRVSRTIERVFSASAMNIAIQDGVDAGQSVPHVHAHIIPRKKDDLSHAGGTDAIYAMMESDDAHLGSQLRERDAKQTLHRSGAAQDERGRFPAVDADDRKPRSEDEMRDEAEWLATQMAEDEQRAR
ncbi:HIT-like protein [Polyplosphaeria fusca]|uniref:Bis(5'-adenosyl)-triphosphatase n=1 Tax=Polyplosphaeria fusca TaxID=682080 RepID=A0A9P4V0B3_9PLEO|nr:HIT-like protein [Polyplosphaeria fusca]